MPKPRTRTTRNRVQPEGVAAWVKDAPPSRYRYNGARPEAASTYTVNGREHRWDGTCHADCEDVR